MGGSNMNFEGKVAIVTGSGQGIGRCIAELFAARGASVVIAENDPALGKDAIGTVGAKGKAILVPTDVADEVSVQDMVGKAISSFGQIDFLINNAAISAGCKPTELSRERWDRVLAVNLTGPFLAAKHAAPHIATHKGVIINIASTRAFMSEPCTEAYSASKGGIVALTHALAASLGPDIRVNCIAPGWIDTIDYRPEPRPADYKLSDADHAQHPAGRVGSPEDIAEMALYLCSPAASFITGQTFVIDGGMTRKMIYV
jgi:NAD(P)-dependent dehydrogenase (short-subunit alcohol dehydrogenase family)